METEGHPEFDYLCVDGFLRDLIGARALASALEIGLIQTLVEAEAISVGDLARQFGMDSAGMQLLCNLLRHSLVLDLDPCGAKLTQEFRSAWRFRDLMVAKVELALQVTSDFVDRFTSLLFDPQKFFQESRLFELFSYDQALSPSPENYTATAHWVKYTTVLTRYEAPVCMLYHDFGRYRRMLDVGGNSGEFALQLCRRNPGLQAAVYDLPLVCDLGREHLRHHPESGRVRFLAAEEGRVELPTGFDLVTFKSMLHDWPEREMRCFLAEALEALEPGGTLLIMERSLFLAENQSFAFASIPLTLFFRAYRSGEQYRQALAETGYVDIQQTNIMLDMPFLLITARKPG